MSNDLSVLICSYKRPDMLHQLLQEMSHAQIPADLNIEVLVVDNDPEQTAKLVTENIAHSTLANSAGNKITFSYHTESKPGISAARNKAWNEAKYNYLCFIDDDQSISSDFFCQIRNVISSPLAKNWSGIKLSVNGNYLTPLSGVKDWMYGFSKWNRYQTLSRGSFATNGLLINKKDFHTKEPFDISLGLTGGEDTKFFLNHSHLNWWCSPKPQISETVPADRCTESYLRKLWIRKGYCDAAIDIEIHGKRAYLSKAFKALILIPLFTISKFLFQFVAPNQHLKLSSVCLLNRQLGKLFSFWGSDIPNHYGRSHEELSPPKVLMVSQHLNVGGAEKILEQYALCHDRSSQDLSYYLYNDTGKDKNHSLVQSVRKKNIKVGSGKKQPGIQLQVWKELRKIVRRDGIQVVHSHDNGALFYVILLKLSNPKLKVFHTVHTLHNWRDSKKLRLLHRAASWILDAVVLVAGHMKNDFQKLKFCRETSFKVIPNGVDIERFVQKPLAKRFDFISVSRVSPEKNIQCLLESYKTLKRDGQEFKALHVGSGCKEHEKNLKSFLANNHLDDNVQFLGYRNDTPDLLNQSHYFLSASNEECHPVSVLEAMATGIPCICSAIPAHRDLERCELFDIDDFQGLAQILRTKLNRKSTPIPVEDRQCAHDNKLLDPNNIRHKYSIKHMIDSYLQLYSL